MTINNARIAALVLAGLATLVRPGAAQTDYYNTDAGRPVTVEDAFPVERYAFELQAAPLRLERRARGVYEWAIEPEIAYGVLPRTQIEIGFPLIVTDNAIGGREFGLAGIDASILHNLNVETETLPAMGLAADVVLPVGPHAANAAFISAKGILTRTFGFARLHANGRYTFGDAPETEEEASIEELSRWSAGVALDKTFPLRSMLLIAEVFASQPMNSDAEVEWNVGTGIRYQQSVRLALDAGIGKTLTGDERNWHLTLGAAYAFAIRALMPR
jgi:hypothetical protein